MADAAAMLTLAARLGRRAAGDVEPNPLVGAVLVRDGRVIGLGHHRRFGGPHAEAEAIADCRARGNDPRGATMYVTLEPCAREGKQPACVGAIVAAGVARVLYARQDPHAKGRGGAESLAAAGVEAALCTESQAATELAAPFVKRVDTGLPWVIAKWAQTLDGRVATRAGESRWISGPLCRRRVHRLRARADAILTGIGTVRADDPMLTARDVPRVRRIAARIVADPRLELPAGSALVRTAREAPVVAAFDAGLAARLADRRRELEAAGIRTLPVPASQRGLDLAFLLRLLAGELEATNVLVEAGPRVLGSLVEAELADECIVHVAPMIVGDNQARAAAEGRIVPDLAGARRLALQRVKHLGGDVELTYRRAQGAGVPVVRPATPADASGIAGVLREAFEEFRSLYTPAAYAATTPAEAQVRERMPGSHAWVALEGGRIVGTASAQPGPNGLHVFSMAVRPSARGRGVGAMLMARIERTAREQGLARVSLSTTPFLVAAIRLYERLGYRRASDGPHDLHGTPLLTMEKFISGDPAAP